MRRRVLRPALARGAMVICDRYYDSTMAYQAYGQGVAISAVASLIRLIDLRPDITFLLRRARRRGQRAPGRPRRGHRPL